MAKKPKLALIPSGYKVNKVYSVLPSDGVGDFDFSRSGNATRVNKQGLIETVISNVPRLDYSGGGCPSLLLEPTRTNILLQSNQFDTTWANLSLSPISGQVGVGGSTDAWLLDVTGNSGSVRQTVTQSGVQSLSVYAKKGSVNWVALYVSSTVDPPYVFFDLENGVVGSSVGDNTINNIIENVGNGWYRCSIIFDRIITSNTIRIFPAKSDNVLSSSGDNIYIQNAQLEQGSYATSYIPTSGSVATRNADECIKENLPTNIISSSYPFTIYGEVLASPNGTTGFTFLNSSSNNQGFSLFYTYSNDTVFFQARANGTIESITSSQTINKDKYFKVAVQMQSANVGKISVNGVVDTKTNFASQAVNSNINDLLIGQFRVVSDTGKRTSVKDLRVYNEALTDQELINLTTI